jgi:phage terminase large subunit
VIEEKTVVKKRKRGRPQGKRKRLEANKKKITITKVFLELKKYEYDVQTFILRGGARSSKSYSLGQFLLDRFFTLPRRQILIMRKTLPALRTSTKMQLMDNLLEDYGLGYRVEEQKLMMNWWYNGALIHFGSLDDPEKIKSTSWNDIWMEEATEFTYEDYLVLSTRLSEPVYGGPPNQLFMSFNPISEFHWIKTKILDPAKERGDKSIIELHSTYRDNPFLDDDYIWKIENLINEDRNTYEVLNLGKWGNLENLIYKNWQKIPFVQLRMMTGMKQCEEIYGLDFGYTRPSVLLRIWIKDDEAYVEEILYQSKLTNKQLIDKLDTLIPLEKRVSCPIYPDNSEPDKIQEIKDAKLGFRVIEANKSLKDGIDYVKRMKLFICDEAVNTLKEISGYCYKVKDGEKLEEPVKFNDHAMDALRYAIYTHLGKKKPKPSIKFI